MRGNIVKIMVVTVAVVLFSIQGWATPILLSPPGSYPEASGDDKIQDWLIALISTYNGTYDPDLTAPVGPHPDLKVDQFVPAPPGYPTFGEDITAITLPIDDYDYLVLHWGGMEGNNYQAYALATPPDSWVFTEPNNKYGLSFYAFYGDGPTSVPEPSTLLLLGAGLVGFGILGRRKFRS